MRRAIVISHTRRDFMGNVKSRPLHYLNCLGGSPDSRFPDNRIIFDRTLTYSIARRFKTVTSMNMSSQKDLRVETPLRHLFDSSSFNVYDTSITNLSVGAPGPDLLLKCCDLFNKATQHRMEKEALTNAFLFQYGPTAGGYEFRTELAKYLSEQYTDHVYSEDLIITTGATQGMHLILSTLIDINGVIFVDEVTYMIALDAFRQFSTMKIVPVPLKEDGVDIVALRKLVEKHRFDSKDKEFWGMYYAIPTFHNPTGILFSEEVCKESITLAREFDLLIACDDVYNLLHYTTPSVPKRLYAYDSADDADYRGNVISNGTFAKIIAPGVRLGWMECPPRCTEIFKNSGILKSGGCTNNYTSGIVASMLQLGLVQSHIKMMSDHYGERMIAMCSVLKEHLPESCTFIEPAGGYFVWIKLPENIDGTKFNEFCHEKYKLSGIVGSRFSVEGGFKNFIRLSIAFHPKDVLENATKRFCVAVKEYCESN